jgi:hypothetical protein
MGSHVVLLFRPGGEVGQARRLHFEVRSFGPQILINKAAIPVPKRFTMISRCELVIRPKEVVGISPAECAGLPQ